MSSTICPNCNAQLRRSRRNWLERRRYDSAWRCEKCNFRRLVKKEKYCWRCGGDLDRRKRSQFLDYIFTAIGMSVYSCRRCTTRRYKFG